MTRRGTATKRIFDVAVSSVLLVATAPLSALTAVLVRRRLGSPVLFRQPRPGKDGEVFTLLKFRTMREPGPGHQTDEERLTPFGRRLRAASLDELPSLLNVLRGDMSLVGPRPLLVSYLDRYTAEQARRHEVRPGITGLAQVAGRNTLPWEDRLRMDVQYVDERTFLMDLKILAATALPVLRRHGITDDHGVSMTEFRGTGS